MLLEGPGECYRREGCDNLSVKVRVEIEIIWTLDIPHATLADLLKDFVVAKRGAYRCSPVLKVFAVDFRALHPVQAMGISRVLESYEWSKENVKGT